MTQLSPAAQAILNVTFPVYDDESLYIATGEQHAGMIAAAALRAAADQVVPDDPHEAAYFTNEAIRLNKQGIRHKLYALATELDGKSTTTETTND